MQSPIYSMQSAALQAILACAKSLIEADGCHYRLPLNLVLVVMLVLSAGLGLAVAAHQMGQIPQLHWTETTKSTRLHPHPATARSPPMGICSHDPPIRDLLPIRDLITAITCLSLPPDCRSAAGQFLR